MSESQKKAKTMFDDYFKAYKNSSQYQDDARYDIAFNKSKYEERVTGLAAGYKVSVVNNIANFRWDNVNYDWYIQEAQKLII